MMILICLYRLIFSEANDKSELIANVDVCKWHLPFQSQQ